MTGYRFFRSGHKWIGIVFSIIFLNLAFTGILLLEKKDHEWIQPATRKGVEGDLDKFISMEEMFERVFAEDREGFRALSDIDRVDFRPNKRVHKIHSKIDHLEMQIDAVTGEILNIDCRRSDFFEALHDGSLFGDWFHSYLMPATAAATVFLTLSGLYLWLQSALRKRSRRKES